MTYQQLYERYIAALLADDQKGDGKLSNSLSNYKPIDDMTKPLHVTIAITRTLKGDGDSSYTYFQSVCSCGWSGDYKVSKLTAQEDKCPNR